MIALLVHLIITAALLLLVAGIVKGVEVTNWGAAFLGAIVLGLVNAVVRPLAVFLTLPLSVLTLGLFLFVINALMFWLVAALVPGVRVRGFVPAFAGSLLLTVLNFVIELLVGSEFTVV